MRRRKEDGFFCGFVVLRFSFVTAKLLQKLFKKSHFYSDAGSLFDREISTDAKQGKKLFIIHAVLRSGSRLESDSPNIKVYLAFAVCMFRYRKKKSKYRKLEITRCRIGK